VGLAFGLLLVSIAGLSRLRFDTDVLSLLPRDGRAIPAFREFLQHFGGFDQLYVVFSAPQGRGIDEYREEIEAWVRRLEALPELERLDAGTPDETRDWAWLASRQLLLLGDQRLDVAMARLRPEGMPRALVETRSLLAVPSEDVASVVRQDPLGLLSLVRDELGGAQIGLNLGGTADGYRSPDGSRRLVLARPVRPPFDAAFSRELMDKLEGLRLPLASDTDAPMSVVFAGGHRIAVETEQVVRRESIGNSIGALALILPLLFVVFRSVWLVTVGAVPSALSLAIVLGVLGFGGATLSAAATGAAAMMFGLGVDGVVLLYVTHRQGQWSGAGDHEADRRLSGASASMLLGMWTTAATFYGLMLVDFPSLTQLGTLVGHSMAVCGVVTLLLVPALLPSRRTATRGRALLMPGFAGRVLRHRRLLLTGAVLLTAVSLLMAGRVRVNPTLERLRSVTPAALFLEEVVRAFGLPSESYVVVTRGRDLETLLQGDERLVAALRLRVPGLPLQAPSQLLPSHARQSHVRGRLARELPASDVILENLRRDAQIAGFTRGAFAPFEERLPRMTSPDAALEFHEFAAHGLGDLIQRFIVRDGTSWLLATYVFPRDGTELAGVEQVVATTGSGAVLTGIPLVNRELSAAFSPQFLRGILIGTVAVVALIALTFRDWRLSLLALAPTAVGLVWAAGTLGALGAELDLFAMFAVVTFIGIGVDYGVHLVHRFRDAGDAGVALTELAPVILVAGGITVLGYGTLLASSYPPLRSMGLVSVVSVVALVAASVVVLPILLAALGPRRD
jgi:predicted exporter